MTAMAMADKKISLVIPEDVIEVLDERAKSIGFSRGQFIVDVLRGAVGLIDNNKTGPDPDGTIPIVIGLPAGSIRDYHIAAQILRTTSTILIEAAIEHGRRACQATAREYAEHLDAEKPLPN